MSAVALSGCGSSASTGVPGNVDEAGTPSPDGGRDDGDRPDASRGDAAKPASGKHVFVTSSLYGGDSFGANGHDPIDEANSLCARAAIAGNLDGQYRAWISTTDTNAITNITNNGPWYLVGSNDRVASSKSSLSGGTIESAISNDEFGQAVPASTECVWTGTSPDGTYSGTCRNWTDLYSSAAIGTASASDEKWSSADLPERCSASCRLYCFQQ